MKGITSTVASVDGQWLQVRQRTSLAHFSERETTQSLDGTIVAWKHKHTKYYTRITNKQSNNTISTTKKLVYPVHDAITVTGCS